MNLMRRATPFRVTTEKSKLAYIDFVAYEASLEDGSIDFFGNSMKRYL